MTICFTGPRPSQLHGYDEPARPLYAQIVDFTLDVILKFARKTPGTNFISRSEEHTSELQSPS